MPEDVSVPGARSERAAWWVASLVIVAILIAEARATWIRYFVNDDYQILYTAWLRSLGKVPPKDFGVQSYHVLPGLFSLFFRIGGDRIETAYWMRAVMWCSLALIAVLSMRLSRRVVPAACAPFAMVASIASWPVLERVLDLRPEAILSVLWLSALLLALRPASAPRSRLAVGAMFGLALALRIKSIVLFPFLVWLVASKIDRRPTAVFVRRLLSELIWFGTGLAGAIGLFLIYLALTGEWPYFVEGNQELLHVFTGALKGGVAGDPGVRGGAMKILWHHDAPLVLLAMLGTFAIARDSRARTPQVLIIGAFVITYFAANPAFYCHNFVLVLPLVAPIIGAGAALLAQLAPAGMPRRLASVALLLALALLHGGALVKLFMQRTNAHQVALAHAFARTRPDTTVFALEGLGLFRPSTYDWRFSAVSMSFYASGAIDLHAQLEAALPEVIVLNYRVPDWLKPKDAAWLTQHYIVYTKQIALRSSWISAAKPDASLHVGRAQPYRVSDGACAVDGAMRQRGERLTLQAGEHSLHFSGEPCVVHFDWPELASLQSNTVPYLMSPEWGIYED